MHAAEGALLASLTSFWGLFIIKKIIKKMTSRKVLITAMKTGKYRVPAMILVLIMTLLAGCGNSIGTSAGDSSAGDSFSTAADTVEQYDTAENSEETASNENAVRTEEVSSSAETDGTSESAAAAETAETAGEAGTAEYASSGESSESAAVTDTAEAAASEEAVLPEEEEKVVYGDERADVYLPLLEGKRVAVFSNQTGIVGNVILTESVSAQEDDLVPFGQTADGTTVEYGEHILDALVRQGVDVAVAFSPEHGFRGTEDAGAQVGSYVDEKTGVPVVSLYGSGSMSPSGADLDRFDTLVIDIQDVGLRYYTYYISMYYLMDACAAAGKEVVILDRPNPNGYYVDGPILQDGFYSGVGMLPLPVVHGMTLGELAQMINGEGWLSAGKDACSLTVVPCENYTHATLTSLVTRPSPNLKDMRAIYLYASTCFFENTAFSVGRGTMNPFEIYGSPYLESAEGFDFTFVPESMEGAHSPVFEGQTCYGKDLREISLEQIMEEHINLSYVIEAYQALQAQNPGISFFGSPDGAGHYWIDYLCGTDQVRRMIEDGSSAEEISASWKEDVEAFRAQRRPYLLYEE